MATPASAAPATASILIVDDTITNLEQLAATLQQWGYEPRPMPSGKLALASARAEAPDLILLDIDMPQMDGYEVCRQLKADEALKDIPVIFITALAGTEEKVRAFAAGAVDYVTKPFQLEEIQARVRAHLKIRSLQRELMIHNKRLERLVSMRTRQLETAYERQLELSRLKDEFFGMISHEIRTPINGVLGLSDLIIGLCHPSQDSETYIRLFRESSDRLRQLLDDIRTIHDLEQNSQTTGGTVSLISLFQEMRSALPQIRVVMEDPSWPDSVIIKGDAKILAKALETSVRLAAVFSQDKTQVRLTGLVEPHQVLVRLKLDALSLSTEQTAEFFKMESQVRSSSLAESMGLAPVVAQKLFAAFGGNLTFIKGAETTGVIEVTLLRTSPAPSED